MTGEAPYPPKAPLRHLALGENGRARVTGIAIRACTLGGGATSNGCDSSETTLCIPHSGS